MDYINQRFLIDGIQFLIDVFRFLIDEFRFLIDVLSTGWVPIRLCPLTVRQSSSKKGPISGPHGVVTSVY